MMPSSKKRIVLITTTQPAANPRLVKEADALSEAGHEVIVLYSYVAKWAQAEDEKIFQQAVWQHRQIGGESESSPKYRRTRLKFAVYKLLNKYSGGQLFSERSMARCFSEILAEAKGLKADMYIGHNPGAMPVAALAAAAVNANAGFDFEDYHYGEFVKSKTLEAKRQAGIEKKYLGSFDYLSVAAPLFESRIKEDNPQVLVPFVTLLNCFPVKTQPVFRETVNTRLQLFWFSQHIGKDRGLEIVMQVLKEYKDSPISLTLAGNCTGETKEYFSEMAGDASSSLFFAGIVPPDKLPEFAARFDLGLALELQSPINRDLCLTNKIFTYLLAGNAVIFTETSAQADFNAQYHAGASFLPGDKAGLKRCINFYRDPAVLLAQRKKNYELAHEKMNWENESAKLTAIIN